MPSFGSDKNGREVVAWGLGKEHVPNLSSMIFFRTISKGNSKHTQARGTPHPYDSHKNPLIYGNGMGSLKEWGVPPAWGFYWEIPSCIKQLLLVCCTSFASLQILLFRPLCLGYTQRSNELPLGIGIWLHPKPVLGPYVFEDQFQTRVLLLEDGEGM